MYVFLMGGAERKKKKSRAWLDRFMVGSRRGQSFWIDGFGLF